MYGTTRGRYISHRLRSHNGPKSVRKDKSFQFSKNWKLNDIYNNFRFKLWPSNCFFLNLLLIVENIRKYRFSYNCHFIRKRNKNYTFRIQTGERSLLSVSRIVKSCLQNCVIRKKLLNVKIKNIFLLFNKKRRIHKSLKNQTIKNVSLLFFWWLTLFKNHVNTTL